jgi:hypothetical protein
MTGFSGVNDDAAPRTLAADMGLAELTAGMALMGRRSRAVADYWRTVTAVRAPGELLSLQLSYWSQMVDDYAAAFRASVAPIAGPPPGDAAPIPDAAPMPAARAA